MGRVDQGVSDSRGRYRVIPRTLCFITHGEDLLLLRGAPDKRIWPNQYNGIGGHIEPDEDVLTAALREIHEETGLEVHELRLRGVINVSVGEAEAGIFLFVFTAQATSRCFTPSPEGTLEWVPLEQVMEGDFVDDLVEDLPLILPRLLSLPADEPPFFAHYAYDRNDELIVTFAGHAPPSVP